MIKLGNLLRLTEKEKEMLVTLSATKEEPNIKTVEGLNNFIDYQISQYGDSPEEQLLKHLLTTKKVKS